MNFKILRLAVLIVLPFLLGSCKKYLDLRPDKKLVIPTTLTDLQALLDNKSFMNFSAPDGDMFASDEYVAPDNIYQAFTARQRLAWIWENYDYNYANDWSALYMPVYYCN